MSAAPHTVYETLFYSLERMFDPRLNLHEGNFRGTFGVRVVKVPASVYLIWNLSLFLLIATFHWGYKEHICHPFFFQVTCLPSTLLMWPKTSASIGLSYCWGEFFIIFVCATFSLSEENVEVGDRKHPCASAVPHMHQIGVTLSSKPVASNMWYDSDL